MNQQATTVSPLALSAADALLVSALLTHLTPSLLGTPAALPAAARDGARDGGAPGA